ncbi:MAG: C39 family peptidase [bacterium]
MISSSGCGVRRFTGLNSPTTYLINGTSHIRQEKNQCGLACLSMVFRYWGRNDIDLSPIESSYALKAENLKKFAEQQGFFAFVYSGSPKDLKEQLDKGRPIIVMTKYIFKLPPMRELQLAKKIVGEGSNHYSVVIGYDDTKRIYIISDPARKTPITIDRFLFEEKWAECDYLTILVVPMIK